MNPASGVQDKTSRKVSIVWCMMLRVYFERPSCCRGVSKSESEQSISQHGDELCRHSIQLDLLATAFNQTIIDLCHDFREVQFVHL